MESETCNVCGNSYDKAFTVTRGDQRWVFDSLECAIHGLAPVCAHCGMKIIGHGTETEAGIFCCAHCARMSGEEGLRDRVPRTESVPPYEHHGISS